MTVMAITIIGIVIACVVTLSFDDERGGNDEQNA